MHFYENPPPQWLLGTRGTRMRHIIPSKMCTVRFLYYSYSSLIENLNLKKNLFLFINNNNSSRLLPILVHQSMFSFFYLF